MSCRCDGCEAVLLGIEQQVLRANQYKENHHRTQQQVEMEVGADLFLTAQCLLIERCCRLDGLVTPG